LVITVSTVSLLLCL